MSPASRTSTRSGGSTHRTQPAKTKASTRKAPTRTKAAGEKAAKPKASARAKAPAKKAGKTKAPAKTRKSPGTARASAAKAPAKAKAPARNVRLFVPEADERAADLELRRGVDAPRVPAWPCAGRMPSRSAGQRERLAPPLEVLWRVPLGAGALSAPVVSWDGVLYVPDREGRLHVLSAETGRAARALATDPIGEGSPVWPLVEQGLVPPDRVPVASAPAISGWLLLYGDDEGIFYCVRRGEGTVLWRKAAPLSFAARRERAYGAPLVAEGRVVTTDADGNLYVADARSGRSEQRLYLRGRPAAAPALARDHLLVAVTPIYPGEPSQLHAITFPDGARAWHRELPGAPREALAAGREEVVVGGEFGLAAFGIVQGDRRWAASADDLGGPVSAPVCLDPWRVYAGAGAQVVAVRLRSGERSWARSTGVSVPISGLACAGDVVWAAAGRTLLALRAESGEVLARVRLPGVAVGGLSLALDRIYVATAAGEVVCLGRSEA